jgi:hypothetical protein
MISGNANFFDAETQRRGEIQEEEKGKKDKDIERPDRSVLFFSPVFFFLESLRVSASLRQDFLRIS